MTQADAGPAPDHGAHDRQRIERLLARYPALSGSETAELVEWFGREASALDVALIASNEDIAGGYRRFRAEHIDRFDGRDAIHAAVFVAILAAAILGVIWLAP